MRTPLLPKGAACALHLTKEYADGNIAGFCGEPHNNPYDFWDEYLKNYAWSIGYQKSSNQRK